MNAPRWDQSMNTPAKRITIKLPNGTIVTVMDLPKNHLKKTLLEELLPRMVEEAVVLSVCDRHGAPVYLNTGAFELFDLPTEHHVLLPDVVAYSHDQQALFLIEVVHSVGCIDRYRINDLKRFALHAPCNVVFVSVFASRAAYAARMGETIADTQVWFVDEPGHSIYVSNSPEKSERIIAARLAKR